MKPRECVSTEPIKEKCERCGDLFYHPKTMIEDARQSASEWEAIAKELEAKLKVADYCLGSIWLKTDDVQIYTRREADWISTHELIERTLKIIRGDSAV